MNSKRKNETYAKLRDELRLVCSPVIQGMMNYYKENPNTTQKECVEATGFDQTAIAGHARICLDRGWIKKKKDGRHVRSTVTSKWDSTLKKIERLEEQIAA